MNTFHSFNSKYILIHSKNLWWEILALERASNGRSRWVSGPNMKLFAWKCIQKEGKSSAHTISHCPMHILERQMARWLRGNFSVVTHKLSCIYTRSTLRVFIIFKMPKHLCSYFASQIPSACSCRFEYIDLHGHFSFPLYFDLSAVKGYLNVKGFFHTCCGIVIHLY